MSMDAIFDVDKKPFVSPVISIGEFRDKALQAQTRIDEYFQIPAIFHLQELQSQPSTSDEALKVEESALEADCRLSFKYFCNSKGIAFDESEEVINQMDGCLQELLMSNPIDSLHTSFPPLESKLKLHKALTTFRKEKDLKKVKNRFLTRGKYFNFRPGELRKGYAEPGKTVDSDCVITVHLIRPKEMNKSKLRAETRLLLRGDMPLTKLRDKIFCAYDYFSNLQDFEDATNPQDYYLNRYPSSFIFIHDTFYIDKRNPNSQDISQPVRDYMASKTKDFGPTKVADIEDFKVKDLTLRLGQPYVFTHLGDCQHLLIFTDLRLLHSTDNQELDYYPVFLSDKVLSPKCCVCKNDKTATFIVSESDRIPVHPAFMCTSCFNSFHYEGNTRIGKFTAFHHIDHTIFE